MTESVGAAMLPLASPAQVRCLLGALLRRNRGRTLAVATLFLAASALGLVVPASLGRIVDAVASQAGAPVIAAWVAGVGVGAIGAAAVALWGARVLTVLVQDTLATLREDVFASAMRLPVSTVDDGESADLLSRVTGDVDAVAEAGGNVVPTLLSASFAIAVSALALAAINPWLALAGLACAPFYVFGTRAFLRRSRVVFREVRAREAARSQAVIEAVEGRDTLIALNEQSLALGRVHSRAEASIETQIEGVRLRNRLFRWINGGEAAGMVALLATGFALHAHGAITIGMASAAVLVFHRLFDPIGRLIFGLDDIQRATIGLARLVGVIDLAPPGVQGAALGHAGGGRGGHGIALRGLGFQYSSTGRGVRDITMRILPGTTAAFVGASGSGKSTLARIIAGHHEPSSGSLHLELAGSAPYYVSQELHHFRGSIADNMRLAVPSATDAEIEAALLAVGAGWATPSLPVSRPSMRGSGVEAHEVPLDEGRIQQLAIARALLADPAIVILDEATADVGLQHRAVVEAAIDALRQDRTAIVIAHRLRQAATADQVFVFDDGGVVQAGPHEALVVTDGPYRRFWLAQTALEYPNEHPDAPLDGASAEHPNPRNETDSL